MAQVRTEFRWMVLVPHRRRVVNIVGIRWLLAALGYVWVLAWSRLTGTDLMQTTRGSAAGCELEPTASRAFSHSLALQRSFGPLRALAAPKRGRWYDFRC